MCALADGEKNVTELTEILGIRQPTLSQQLARLRAEKMVATRREQNQVYYRLLSDEAELVMGLVFELFCAGSDLELPESRRRRHRDEQAVTTAADLTGSRSDDTINPRRGSDRKIARYIAEQTSNRTTVFVRKSASRRRTSAVRFQPSTHS